jgi:hypothetical protein
VKRWSRAEPFAIDPAGTAGSISAVAGVASVAWPFFDGLVAALAALTVLAWLVARRSPAVRSRRLGPAAVITLVVAGWAFFALAEGPWGVARGAGLGLASAGIGWIGRRSPAFGEGA